MLQAKPITNIPTSKMPKKIVSFSLDFIILLNYFLIFFGIVLVGIFVIGLAWSISTGLAGFWKGLPFWIIVIFCLYLLILDSLKSIKK